MDSGRGGWLRALFVTHSFSLDIALHPPVSAYLSGKLGVVLMILPDTVVAGMSWWIFAQYNICTEVLHGLCCRSSHLSHLSPWEAARSVWGRGNFYRTWGFPCWFCGLGFNSEFSPGLSLLPVPYSPQNLGYGTKWEVQHWLGDVHNELDTVFIVI